MSVTKLTNTDREYLLSHSAKYMPNNPTLEGWSGERVRETFWYPVKIEFDWIQRLADETYALEAGLGGGTVVPAHATKADQDGDGNVIKTTYAKLAGANTMSGNNTFSGINTFSGDAYFTKIGGNKTVVGTTAFSNNVSFGSSGSDNSKTLDVYFTMNLRGPVYSNSIIPGNTFALGSAEHYWGEAFIDDLYLYGEISDGLHEWAMPSTSGTLALESYVDTAETTAKNYADSQVGKLLDGTNAAMKAKQDADGNVISSTYVKIASVVNGLDSDSTVDPLSAYQGKVLKTAISTINTLLASDDDTLNEIQEIVEYIKSNRSYIEQYSTSKVNVSDIIDGLTSEIATKPLSAKQGKVLNDRIDAIEDDYIALGLVEVTDYSQSTGEISIIHSSELSSSYDSSSGIVTITY